MHIIGAGMAGLIAANYFRSFAPTVHEAQTRLPNNHSALLRFKTDKISNGTGIPFKRVFVRKFAMHGQGYVEFMNPYCANQYSFKVSGTYTDRSVWNLEPGYRYIAPPDFISKLANGLNIKYKDPIDLKGFAKLGDSGPVISTIPMPVIAKTLGHGGPKFTQNHIWTINTTIDAPLCDLYMTIYYTGDDDLRYRASITGNQLTIESTEESEGPMELVMETLAHFGILPFDELKLGPLEQKRQGYGKIVRIDEDWRREFIYMLTRDYNIYSLGRYATWRQILLDDLSHDMEVIGSIIKAETRRKDYHQSLAIAARDRERIQ